MAYTLDLNAPFTESDVAALLGSENDDQDWQLRVSTQGVAYLSKDVGADNLDDVLFRVETWDEGSGYVGEGAADDTEWVKRIYNVLSKNWPEPTSSYIDFF
ncbi:hypothetical protein GCM10022228_04870 [Halomonas cibimaris]|uniref:Uncharacterized protein n=1 Tax=Halomonas cibimaris TaxID=657012 RepID=A0ABP7LAJ4_9GAMM